MKLYVAGGFIGSFWFFVLLFIYFIYLFESVPGRVHTSWGRGRGGIGLLPAERGALVGAPSHGLMT